MRTVGETMTHEVVTVHPDTPFKQLVQVLMRHGIDAVPVVRDGELLGVVSAADLTCHEESPPTLATLLVGGRTVRQHARKARGRTAGELQSSPARTVGPQASVCEALAAMGRARVGRMVVVEDGVVVGILTRTDLLRVFTRDDHELEREVDGAVRRVVAADDDVRVVVADGTVHLRGVVARASSACAATAAAHEVTGVVDVEDELTADVDDLAVLTGVPGF